MIYIQFKKTFEWMTKVGTFSVKEGLGKILLSQIKTSRANYSSPWVGEQVLLTFHNWGIFVIFFNYLFIFFFLFTSFIPHRCQATCAPFLARFMRTNLDLQNFAFRANLKGGWSGDNLVSNVAFDFHALQRGRVKIW